MTDNVVSLGVVTTQPHEPAYVLEKARQADLDIVVIVGADSEGNLYFAGSHSENAEVNLLLDYAKAQILGIATSQDD